MVARGIQAIAPHLAGHLDIPLAFPLGHTFTVGLTTTFGFATGLIAKSESRTVAGIDGPFVTALLGLRGSL